MDGGAYCTLTPVVLSRGALHAGGPYRCPNVRIRARATRTNTPPNGAFRGFGAPQVEFAAETQLNRIAERLGLSPLEIRRRNVYRLGDTTPTGQVLRESVAGEEVLERAAEAGEFERLRARHDAARHQRRGIRHGARRRRCGRAASGSPSGVGLALAWHGAGFTGIGRGQARLGRLARADRRGRDPDPDRLDRDGPGDARRSSRSWSPRRWASRSRRSSRRPGHRLRPGFRPDRRVADGDGRRRAADQGGASACGPRSRPPPAARSPRPTVTSRGRHGPLRIDQRFEPYPGVGFDDATYRGDAYPAFGWAACVARVEVDLDTGEVRRPRRRRRRRRRPGHPSGPGRGPGRGRHAPGGRLRDDRGDQAARRPLPQRPARDLHHPDRARRPADHDDPGRGAVRRRRRTARRASASCRWTSGRRR